MSVRLVLGIDDTMTDQEIARVGRSVCDLARESTTQENFVVGVVLASNYSGLDERRGAEIAGAMSAAFCPNEYHRLFD